MQKHRFSETPRRGIIPQHPNKSAQQAWTILMFIVIGLVLIAGSVYIMTTPEAFKLIDAFGGIPHPSP